MAIRPGDLTDRAEREAPVNRDPLEHAETVPVEPPRDERGSRPTAPDPEPDPDPEEPAEPVEAPSPPPAIQAPEDGASS